MKHCTRSVLRFLDFKCPSLLAVNLVYIEVAVEFSCHTYVDFFTILIIVILIQGLYVNLPDSERRKTRMIVDC